METPELRSLVLQGIEVGIRIPASGADPSIRENLCNRDVRMNLRTRITAAASLFAVLVFLLSCNFPRPPSPEQLTQTAAAATLSAEQTLASLATSTPTPTLTPVPATPTQTATPSPQPTATPSCVDGSVFVSDITIADNTPLKPGQPFRKTWRLRNSGTCEWTTGFEAVRIGGANLGGPAAVALAEAAPPDATLDISIDLTAPTTNGVYRSNYQLRNAADAPFGVVFYVQILVGPTPTPSARIHLTGRVTIDNGAFIDFDTGTSAGDPWGDVRLQYVSDTERYLEPANGAGLRPMSGEPSRETCESASLGGGAVSFNDFGTGSYFCYRTSSGRFGRFQVEKIEADSIGFDFRTWD